jgi:hypothetical protein
LAVGEPVGMVRAKKDSCPVKPIVGVFNSGAKVLDFQNSRPRMCALQNYVTVYVANCKTWRVRWL